MLTIRYRCGDKAIKDEDDLAWDYFDKDPFIVLGYDATASRDFDVVIENQRSVVVTFTLTFGAATFKNNFATNGQELEAALFGDIIGIVREGN